MSSSNSIVSVIVHTSVADIVTPLKNPNKWDLIPEFVKLDRSDMIRAIQVLASELAKEELAMNESSLDDATANALAFYNSELASRLEPAHNGENVAIHVDTKSYEIANGVGHAFRAARAKHPEGAIVVHRIGIAEPSLASRRV